MYVSIYNKFLHKNGQHYRVGDYTILRETYYLKKKQYPSALLLVLVQNKKKIAFEMQNNKIFLRNAQKIINLLTVLLNTFINTISRPAILVHRVEFDVLDTNQR